MYKALYRKWRPKTFDDVIGQEHVTRTLKNEVCSGRISHAYLFTGSRGTGKTSCAKILAQAINCKSHVNGNPCGKCEICQRLKLDNSLDIFEIDAASNNGVENIRSIKEEMVFTPTTCKYKVYIVDEVHMLSLGAFNAFLKILEEPPSHIIFILATTEIHKLPVTIISRCQKFEFHRLSNSQICLQVKRISEYEGIKIDDPAAMQISIAADGAMRDALSLLEQCYNLCPKFLNEDSVRDILGVPKKEYIFGIVSKIFLGNFYESLNYIDQIYKSSGNLVKFCEEIIECFKNIMLYKTTSLHKYSLENKNLNFEKLSLEDITYCLDLLQTTYKNMIAGSNKKLELEIATIKLCSKFFKTKENENTKVYINRASEEDASNNILNNNIKEHSKPKKDFNVQLLENWDKILKQIKENLNLKSLYASLESSVAYEHSNKILINPKSSIAFELLKNQEYKTNLQKIIYQVLGKKYSIEPYNLNFSDQAENLSKASDNHLESFIKQAKLSNIEILIDK